MDANREEVLVTKTTEELWQQLHDSLRAFIAKRIDDHGHVDDILQEVFVRVHRQIDSREGEDYLYRRWEVWRDR